MFGEREMEKRLWPTLVKSALTDRDLDLTAGQQIREFIYVKDVAEEFIRQSKSISSSNLGFKVLNLGTKNELTLKEFASFWWTVLGAKSKLRFGSVPYRKNEVMRIVGGDDKICLQTSGFLV